MSKPKILHFSVSLNVKDIEASKAFYEKLGFEPYEGAGSVEEKWLIMVYGDAKIGLFQDMFPLNTITLNPDDARTMMKTAKENGLETTSEMGMDEASGPAAFSLVDPDGNPVLIDQHF
ncbi:catechol 2,3-dioxygenase-like lactoylglutathione lyase family enzyme [Roseivirga pacifica]|uniref:Catechol 2,3-dioxygenase n=1 Tax=Roseivirga pacifica TaxID=1267423 RepID=A0A1I0QQ38_9BACT|nr:VOC family protein [Roseivirga pacifica]MCO6361022.1 VOC family protein [Roseivirga pacifica]MCO6368911.1 VOC family protein [Roseivirga pacifica]MCO6373054.1 VOC family protein [Roseivirga pacifica]MCO6373134.1 VOC family protein [Roseivirga pacifica]MCO6377609.1 VOC family protein [Roseivirga pacifica]